MQIFAANSKGKKPFWRAGHRWDYNIKVNIKETMCKDSCGSSWSLMVVCYEQCNSP
jgi:hypothetical protein